MNKIVKGFKGFEKGLKCRDFQYEVGKSYKHDGEIELCQKGFHFCENPLDVLSFYPLNTSEFAQIEAAGKIKSDKQKSVTDNITIKAKIDLPFLIKASFDFIWSVASKKGILKKSRATSGYGAHSATSGNDAIACSVGRKASAKATIGCWIVLAEWKEGQIFTDAKPIDVKAAIVDGKKIKADTWYRLVDGKFVEAKDITD